MEARSKSFGELFCGHFKCSAEAYEQEMFRRCLYRRAFPFVRCIKLINPGYFDKDLAVIRQLGITTSPREFQDEVEAYFYHVRRYGSVFQRVWAIRISGKRLMQLSELFESGHSADSLS